MNYKIGISEKFLLELGIILASHKITQVLFFGSRNSGDFTETSDLDLIVLEPKNIELKSWAILKLDLEESNIPIKIDIQRYESVSARFLKLITAQSSVWNISQKGIIETVDIK